MGKAMQGAGGNCLPLGIKGPEPLSLWETVFLKLLRAADGTCAREGGEGADGCRDRKRSLCGWAAAGSVPGR